MDKRLPSREADFFLVWQQWISILSIISIDENTMRICQNMNQIKCKHLEVKKKKTQQSGRCYMNTDWDELFPVN